MATLTPLLKHPTQQDVGMCYKEHWLLLLTHREGHSNITTKSWSGAKELQGKAPERLLPRATQLFLHPRAPLQFFLSSPPLPLHPTYVSPSLLHVDS